MRPRIPPPSRDNSLFLFGANAFIPFELFGVFLLESESTNGVAVVSIGSSRSQEPLSPI